MTEFKVPKRPANARKRLIEEETVEGESVKSQKKEAEAVKEEDDDGHQEEQVDSDGEPINITFKKEDDDGKREKEETKPKIRIGPSIEQNKVRFSVRFDYARDICKDYNETGFCGFGDSCKFLHDRGDYKSGWELEAEWEEQQRKLREAVPERKSEEIVQEEEPKEIPTTCGICKNTFQSPIVETKCGHLFCEKCALAFARTSSKCHTCSALINGQFKIVKTLNR